MIFKILVLLFVSFNTYAQQGYKIKYESLSYDSEQHDFYKSEYSYVTLFNDSFFYSYSYKWKRDRYKKATFYGRYSDNHDRFYSVVENKWYHISKSINERVSYKKIMNLPITEWHIQSDSTRNILGYNCQRAVSMDSGNIKFIWFTNDIPYNYGVLDGNKYPGLVLELYDDNRDWFFRAIEIETGTYKIVVPNYKIKEEDNLPQPKNTP